MSENMWGEILKTSQESKIITNFANQEIPRPEFLPSQGTAYFRLMPFKNDNGEFELKREFSYHRIPTPDKNGNFKTKNDGTLTKLNIPCEGKDCRFCKQVQRIRAKNPQDKNAFIYGQQNDFFVLGLPLKLVGGKLVPKDDQGIRPLQLSGGYKQASALLEFLSKDLMDEAIGLKYANLAGLTTAEVYERVFGFEYGFPLELSSEVTSTAAGKTKRDVQINLLTTQTFPLKETSYNLYKIYNYVQAVTDRAYGSLTSIVNDIVGDSNQDNNIDANANADFESALQSEIDSVLNLDHL